jgi:hypothetical protein
METRKSNRKPSAKVVAGGAVALFAVLFVLLTFQLSAKNGGSQTTAAVPPTAPAAARERAARAFTEGVETDEDAESDDDLAPAAPEFDEPAEEALPEIEEPIEEALPESPPVTTSPS